MSHRHTTTRRYPSTPLLDAPRRVSIDIPTSSSHPMVSGHANVLRRCASGLTTPRRVRISGPDIETRLVPPGRGQRVLHGDPEASTLRQRHHDAPTPLDAHPRCPAPRPRPSACLDQVPRPHLSPDRPKTPRSTVSLRRERMLKTARQANTTHTPSGVLGNVSQSVHRPSLRVHRSRLTRFGIRRDASSPGVVGYALLPPCSENTSAAGTGQNGGVRSERRCGSRRTGWVRADVCKSGRSQGGLWRPKMKTSGTERGVL
ncbi:hypothetical protein C8Q80DRAFT_1357648 [Daedaleopsis nitida]|nr:hypothetical protein C8Q80DRAFT_1357648 [Daedaleopsis nitida]